MASTASLLPQQQQPAAAGEVEVNSRSASSGSIGPFFAVISVLTVLAIISCVLGRVFTRKHGVSSSTSTSPLENIKHIDCFGWLKRRGCRRRSIVGELDQVGAAKVMALGEETNNVKAKDGKVDQDPPQA